jgi:hypothetical protein
MGAELRLCAVFAFTLACTSALSLLDAPASASLLLVFNCALASAVAALHDMLIAQRATAQAPR